jgi:hypothetical protein
MKDLLKETGKYLYDISKIILGVGVIAPILNNNTIHISVIIAPFCIFLSGAYLIYKGEKL